MFPKKLGGRELETVFIQHLSQTPENGVENLHISQVRTVETAILFADNIGRNPGKHAPAAVQVDFSLKDYLMASIMGKNEPTPSREARGCIDFILFQVREIT